VSSQYGRERGVGGEGGAARPAAALRGWCFAGVGARAWDGSLALSVVCLHARLTIAG